VISVNKVILIGFIGKDPEIHYVSEGLAYTKFSLATNESYLNKNNEKVTTTEWHTIVLWQQLAEFADKYIKKGSLIYVEGKIRYRDQADDVGNVTHSPYIYGTSVQLLDRKQKPMENELPNNGQTQLITDFKVDEFDNLPF